MSTSLVSGGPCPLSREFARISTTVRDRGSLPTVSGEVSLAGGVQLSAMWTPTSLHDAETPALAMCRMSVSSLPDGRNYSSQHEAAADDLVLGCISDDDR